MSKLDTVIERDAAPHAGPVDMKLEVVVVPVSDIEAARAELVERGARVSEVFHRAVGEGPLSGRDPARRSYASYATFTDPDGNEWLLQEVTVRLPGRVDGDHTT